MKYIFYPIWAVLVIVWTLFESVWFLFIYFLLFIWEFKKPNLKWSDFHMATEDWQNEWGGYAYKDLTIFDTLKRRLIEE